MIFFFLRVLATTAANRALERAADCTWRRTRGAYAGLAVGFVACIAIVTLAGRACWSFATNAIGASADAAVGTTTAEAVKVKARDAVNTHANVAKQTQLASAIVSTIRIAIVALATFVFPFVAIIVAFFNVRRAKHGSSSVRTGR